MHTVLQADLVRHLWTVGARVRDRDMEGVVTQVLHGPVVHYRVSFPHKTAVLREDTLDEGPANPGERLLAGEFEDLRYFELRARAIRIRVAYTFEDLVSLTNARVELKPHQVFVAHRVVQYPKPRFLLADEVGLGKTIEAGMILKELRARGLLERVLAIVPANLVSQWVRELSNKFNEDFMVYDALTLRYLERERPGENPWALSPRIITSLQLARREEKREQIAEAHWDMVIIDEAHHLRRYLEGYDEQGRSKVRNTQSYLLGEAVSGNAESLLCLTATPLQLRTFELYSLLALVDPSLFSGYADFERFRMLTLRRVNEAHGILSGVPSSGEYERLRLVWEELRKEPSSLPPLPPPDALSDNVRGELLGGLRELHRLSKVMIRNRRREIGGFPPRNAHVVTVRLTPEELDLYEAVSEYVREGYRAAERAEDRIAGFLMVTFQKILASSTKALRVALERRRAKLIRGDALDAELAELLAKGGIATDDLATALPAQDGGGEWESEELSQVLVQAEACSGEGLVEAEVARLDGIIERIKALPRDPKAVELIGAIRSILEPYPEEKVLIFTQFLETQRYLKELLEKEGCSVEVFSGSMSAKEKDAATERFRGRSQIMISTEAGGEGRNFQFCHIMFNYDLPWNPMRIEQRIGRLDRIGQRKAVHIYNLAAVGTVEERVLDVLQNRIRLFEETIGSLDPILGEFEQDLSHLIMSARANFARELENFGVNWEKKVADARAMEERLGDFIMDVRSFRRDEVDRLLARRLPVTHTHLRDLVQDFIGLYPLDAGKFEERRDGIVAIEVPRAFVEQAGGRVRDMYVGTFDPQVALARESLDFFAIGHELVDEILELCRADRFDGLTALRVADSPSDRGFWGVQCNFLVEYSGVRPYPKFVPIVAGFDGDADGERTQRLVSASPITAGPPQLPEGWRERAEEAIRQSELALIDHIAAEIEDLRRRNDLDFHALLGRTQKLYGYRLERARERLEEDRATLDRFTRSRDPDERRVVPIWQQRVHDGEVRIGALEREREQELLSLEGRREITYQFQMVNAALLHVPGEG